MPSLNAKSKTMSRKPIEKEEAVPSLFSSCLSNGLSGGVRRTLWVRKVTTLRSPKTFCLTCLFLRLWRPDRAQLPSACFSCLIPSLHAWPTSNLEQGRVYTSMKVIDKDFHSSCRSRGRLLSRCFRFLLAPFPTGVSAMQLLKAEECHPLPRPMKNAFSLVVAPLKSYPFVSSPLATGRPFLLLHPRERGKVADRLSLP